MKQRIYLAGLLSVILAVVGIIFKLNHWPAAGIIICTGIFILVVLFLPLALINNYRTATGDRSMVLSFVTWLTCFIIFTSMLFKIMHWPGAGITVMIALPFPFVVFLPVYLVVTSRIKGFDINNTIFVLFLLALQAVFSALLALNVSRERLYDSTVLTNNYINTSNIYRQFQSGGSDAALNERKASAIVAADRLIGLIEQSNNLIRRLTSSDISKENLISSVYDKLDSRTIAGKALLSGSVPVQSERLKEGLDEFITKLNELDQTGQLLKLASGLYDLDQEPRDLAWAERLFASNYLAWVLADLGSMEANTRILRELITGFD